MPRKKTPQSSHAEVLSAQIRRCILESGITRYRISKETGVSEGSLSQFVNGHRGLSVEAMDLIGVFLGLSVVAVESGRVQGRSPKGKRNGESSTGR